MGAAVTYRFRAELRQSWRSQLIAALAIALIAGGSLAAFAGARRTTSAMPRLVEETRVNDVLVNPDRGTFSRLTPERLAALPEVEDAGVMWGTFVIPALPDGSPDEGAGNMTLAVDGGAGRQFDRPVITEGRFPRPDETYTVFLSDAVADHLGVGPGDEFPALVIGLPDLQEWEEAGGEGPMPFEKLDLAVAGIGYFADEVQVEDGFDNSRITLTEAFFAEHGDAVGFWGGTVEVRPGVTRSEFEAAVAALAPDEAVAFQWTDVNVDRFQTAVRPQAVSLVAFGGVLAVVAAVGTALVLGRHSDRVAWERQLTRAIGFPRRSLLALGALHAATFGAVVVLGAVLSAVALSPLTPIGPARRAEPDPGVAVDVLVLAIGALASVGLVVVIGLGVTHFAVARTIGTRGRVARSRVAEALARAGLNPPAVVGTRLALERGAGSTQVPVRMTLAGAVVAVAAVVAASTFTSSLDRVVATPALYGSNWDAVADVAPPAEQVSGQESFAEFEATVAELVADRTSQLEQIPEVEGVSIASFAQIPLGPLSVPALGIDPLQGSVHPTLVAGTLPADDHEIVLGLRTMRQLGLDVGDEVSSGRTRLEVVGRAVFPGYAVYSGQDKTALGDGGWMTVAGLARVGQTFEGRTFLIDVAEGADPAELLEPVFPSADGDDAVVYDRFRPTEVDTLNRVRSTPAVLAAVLAFLGVVAVAYVLIAAIHRRRQLLALLRVVGFTGGQVTSALLWNAAVVAAIAVVIGIPLGAAIGRWSWTTVIDQLGGHAGAVVPWTLTFAAVAATFATTIVASIVPARRAARVRPAVALRTQ